MTEITFSANRLLYLLLFRYRIASLNIIYIGLLNEKSVGSMKSI